MSGLSLEQSEQVYHLAQLAFLGISARAVAAAEFESSPEVGEIRIAIARPTRGGQTSVDIEIVNTSGIPVGGMSV